MASYTSFATGTARLFLITEDLLQNVQACDIEPSIQSDHSIITLKLKYSEFDHGKGLWKHINALLIDQNYINKINSKINEIKVQYCLPVYNIENMDSISDNDIQFTINDQLFLETLLMELRGVSISHGSYIKKKMNTREQTILSTIKTVKENLTDDEINELTILRQELKEIRDQKLKGHIIRSKAKWIEEGEKHRISLQV